MRLPGVILVAGAFIILLVENLQLALLLVEVSGLLIAAAFVILLVEKLALPSFPWVIFRGGVSSSRLGRGGRGR